MGKIRSLSWVLAIFAPLAGGSAALADSLPAGTSFVSCTTPSGGSVSDPLSCDGGTSQGAVTYAPFAGVSGSANGQGLVESAGLFGVLNYSFEVTGGTAGDIVPVDIDASLQATPNGGGYVFSEIIVTANSSTDAVICNSGCGDAGTSFTGTLHVDAVSGAVYTNAVHLEIDVIGALDATFDGGTASADPFIYVAPTFSDASEYSIEVSPNIGNVAASAPEASTWAMMLTGFAGLGFAGFRASRKTAVRI